MSIIPNTLIESTHRLGKKYRIHGQGEPYVLAQVSPGMVALIGGTFGNRYNNPVQVVSLPDIGDLEWGLISMNPDGDTFFEVVSEDSKIGGCEDIPDVVDGIRVSFRYIGKLTLCYVWVRSRLRVGTAYRSDTDLPKMQKGEKIAMKRALEQHDLCLMVRTVLWEQYLVTKNVKIQESGLIDFFKGI